MLYFHEERFSISIPKPLMRAILNAYSPKKGKNHDIMRYGVMTRFYNFTSLVFTDGHKLTAFYVSTPNSAHHPKELVSDLDKYSFNFDKSIIESLLGGADSIELGLPLEAAVDTHTEIGFVRAGVYTAFGKTQHAIYGQGENHITWPHNAWPESLQHRVLMDSLFKAKRTAEPSTKLANTLHDDLKGLAYSDKENPKLASYADTRFVNPFYMAQLMELAAAHKRITKTSSSAYVGTQILMTQTGDSEYDHLRPLLIFTDSYAATDTSYCLSALMPVRY
jgi:hypothetical protein